MMWHMTLLVVLFVSCVLSAQQQEPLLIEHADQMVGYQTPDGPIRELQGGVVLVQGSVVVRCDRARQEINSGRVEIIGHIRITQGALTMTMQRGIYLATQKRAIGQGDVEIRDSVAYLHAPYGTYEIPTQQAIFTGGVTLQDDSVTIFCDSLQYNRRTQERRAWGNVTIMFRTDSAIIRGDSALQYVTPNTAWICGKAFLMQWDSTLHDTLYLRAGCLYREQDLQQVYMRGEGTVAILHGALSARADTVNLCGEQLFVLEGAPIVWADSAQLTGSVIIGYFVDRRLRSVCAQGAATLGIVDDTANVYPHQLIADTISLVFVQDSLRYVTGSGMVRTLYQNRTEDGKPDGITRVASDSIAIAFSAGAIDQVRWFGGIRSEYIPEHLVHDAERFLQGFRWRSETRPRREELLHVTGVKSQR